MIYITKPKSAAAKQAKFTEYAHKSSSAPPSGSRCSKVVISPEQIGRACFEAHGDEFWVNDDEKDGRHIEMRGLVNETGDAFICKGSGSLSMGWQVCETFKTHIVEGATLWFAADLYNGDTYITSGPHVVTST